MGWVQADVAGAVASFMLQDLRRYQMFDSSATRPYTVSAMACWKRASDLGYITLDASNKVSPPPPPPPPSCCMHCLVALQHDVSRASVPYSFCRCG